MVRRLRKNAGLRLVDLSEKTGVSVPLLNQIENGNARITGDVAMALAAWSGEPAEVFWQPRDGAPSSNGGDSAAAANER